MVEQLVSSVAKLRLRNKHGQSKSRKSLFRSGEEDITSFDHLSYTLTRKAGKSIYNKKKPEKRKFWKNIPIKVN